ncbi:MULTISPECIES: hypothetical protein [unclassified Arthrobacter]|uniref:hypothetical protein n=1 Tax=unclassified Arthrobacter TaxID=235627 RepID=UPI00149135D7|nr:MULTISPECIES: hypothetical protein [unclassified Arthrobacter]NOJ63042.1 hypothetical protein [Arthrobacter sp. 147(2020)]
MTKVFSRIAKYGTVIGFMAAALMLIFGVRYFFERDLSAALGGAAGAAIGLAVGLPLASHLLRRKERRQSAAGRIEVSMRALSGDDGIATRWRTGEVLIGPGTLAFHRHWRTFAIRSSKEPVLIQIVGEVGGPLRKPGKWEAFNRLNGKEEVLALGTPSGRIEVAATPARLRMIQQRLAPPPGGPSVPR